jgi:uncharacterized lipoprotein NlpE involved in copper resistance
LVKVQGLDESYVNNTDYTYVQEEFKKTYDLATKDAKRKSFQMTFLQMTFRQDFMGLLIEKHNKVGEFLYDLDNEFITRFSYPPETINVVSDFIRGIYSAHIDGENEDKESIKLEMNNRLQYVFDSNLSNTIGGAENSKRLEDLCVMLSILWLNNYHKLLCKCCNHLRETFEKKANGDSYPNYQTAFLHAASILANKDKEKDYFKKVEEILECVNKKYGKKTDRNKNKNKKITYKAWIGQSFIYIKLWESFISRISIPENSYTHDIAESIVKLRKKYYEKSSAFAKKAFEKIRERKVNNSDQAKENERNRRYYYAINNYIYIETLNRPLEDFPGDLEHLVRELETVSKPGLQHERYYDTLARFDQRMAAKIAITDKKQNKQYTQYIKSALVKIKKAMVRAKNKNNKIDLLLFEALHIELEKMNIHGLEYYSKSNT